MSTTNTASNVSTGKPAVGGAVFVAPAGTTLPASAVATIGSTFKGLGYISEDGLTNSPSFDVENIKAWGGDTVYTVETGKEDTWQFKLIETKNLDVLKTVFGSTNVTGSALSSGITIKANSLPHEELAWVFDMILRGGDLKRVCVPKAAITEIGDIVYKDDEEIGYEVTITAVPDENGNTHYEYIQTPSTSGSGG